MSRREGRDSDSKRRHSRFDREPSPKRSKRDEKQVRERDRVISSANVENGIGNRTDRDQKHHHQLQVGLPPEAPSAHDPKREARALNKDSDKKPNYCNEAPKRSSNPTEVPRSSSYFQHDERSSTGQVRRSSGRMATGERGWWKDSREKLNEKETSHRREQRDGEKSQAKPDNNTSLRKDGLSERRFDLPPTTKKRPAFREKKIPVDQEDARPAATETGKSSQTDHPLERKERREEGSYNPRHLERPDKQYAGDKAPNKNESRRDVFSSRGRYNGNYGGRDRFQGREDFRVTKTGIDKWKHDLYQEVNKDPIPKNEDDQIAKLEALLAS